MASILASRFARSTNGNRVVVTGLQQCWCALLAQKNHCAQHVPSHLAEHFSGEAFVRNPPNKIQWTSFCSSILHYYSSNHHLTSS